MCASKLWCKLNMIPCTMIVVEVPVKVFLPERHGFTRTTMGEDIQGLYLFLEKNESEMIMIFRF
jgi:hypothetical protein